VARVGEEEGEFEYLGYLGYRLDAGSFVADLATARNELRGRIAGDPHSDRKCTVSSKSTILSTRGPRESTSLTRTAPIYNFTYGDPSSLYYTNSTIEFTIARRTLTVKELTRLREGSHFRISHDRLVPLRMNKEKSHTCPFENKDVRGPMRQDVPATVPFMYLCVCPQGLDGFG
jgi:hypothetical protein